MIRPLKPLRKRSPFIGAPPGVVVPPPARRPRPALIVAAATAFLPRPLPPQPRVSPPRRPTPPPPAVTREVKVVRRDERRFAGAVFRVKIPARTFRLAPFQTKPQVYRRDERGFAGRVYVGSPHRAGAAVVVPTTEKLFALVVQREPRRPAGTVWQNRVPARTVRLAAFQAEPLVVRRDERRGPGSVWLNKVPARTLRLAAFQTDALGVRPPAPEPRRGQVLTSPPHRATDPRPAKRPLLISPIRPPGAGGVWLSRSLPRTVRLASFQTLALLVRRDERRFAGRVWLGSPSRTGTAVVVPTTSKLFARVVRRDERRYGGAVWSNRVPDRTVRLGAFQTESLLARRDERRYPGAVLITHVPARTVRLAPFQLAARIVPPPAREGRRGTVYLGSPHRDTSPKPAKRALIAAPTPPRPGGSVFTVRVPSRTVRLTPLQLTAAKARRDERGFAGKVFLAGPSRTGTAVVVPRLPRHLVVRRDERAFAGRVVALRVPARTVRLTPLQTTTRAVPPTPPLPPSLRAGVVRMGAPPKSAALVVTPSPARLAKIQAAGRPEPRRGAVLIGRVPARTLRLAPFQTAPRLIRRDQRGFGGSVLFTTPHRPTTTAPAAQRAVLVVRRDERRGSGRALFLVPRRPTLRLAPSQLRATVAQRVFPRPGGTPGAVLFVRPARPRIVPRLPRHLIVRRDDRRGRPTVLTSPTGRFNAIVVTHGNPRAGLTKRAGAAAVLVQRGKPAASVVLRRPTASVTMTEG